MPINRIGIIESKFKRDGKMLVKTFLVSSLTTQEMKDVLDDINKKVPNGIGEDKILFYYDNSNNWYTISNKNIVDCRDGVIKKIHLHDVQKVNPIIDTTFIIENKRNGLTSLILLLKDDSVYYLTIEKLSFGLIDGIISYLLPS